MKYHLITLLLIVAAGVLQTVRQGGTGDVLGVALVGVGVALEVWFWIRLTHGRRVRRAQ